MPTMREFGEQNMLDTLKVTIPDQDLLAHIKASYEHDHTAIERQEIQLQASYQTIARPLQEVSRLSGMPLVQVLNVANAMRWPLEWTMPQMLSHLHGFYATK